MTSNFSEVMSQRTDKQLAEILTIKRHEYQDEAINAAQAEFDKRKLDLKEFVTNENINNITERLDPTTKEELRLNWFYKILVFILPGPVTAIWGFICRNIFESSSLRILTIPIIISSQILIFRKLKTSGYTKLALDFKLWTLNGWIFYSALAVLIFILEFFLKHG